LSSRSRRSAKSLSVIAALTLVFGSGCWENWAPIWFPMMKRQPAVQAFENTGLPGHSWGLPPVEGTLPIDGGEPAIDRLDLVAADALENPFARDSLRSLENGREQYTQFCATCHGATGRAEGPVAKVFAGVFPLVGLTTGRSDGYLYTVIRYGAGGKAGLRMPGYDRIAPDDRWDIVNYVRYLDRVGSQGGAP
jgi:mono/diheme cytochrome c family protein